jgi:hypothetical protein
LPTGEEFKGILWIRRFDMRAPGAYFEPLFFSVIMGFWLGTSVGRKEDGFWPLVFR